jgi:hypothetical protein
MNLRRRVLSGARRAVHHGVIGVCSPRALAYEQALRNPRKAQEQRLEAVLRAIAGTELSRVHGLRPGMSAAEFRSRVPESRYEDLRPMVERQKRGEPKVLTNKPCPRYQPTSGSSAKVKWVPYTEEFLAELDAAISPWGYDMYRASPRARQGRHYWSLSWLPTHLRESTDSNVNDDAALLSWSKRFYAALSSPVPPWVSYAKTSEDSVLATLVYLCAADDLTMISVWSPTFMLNLFEKLAERKDEVVAILDSGSWGDAYPDFPGRPPRSLRAAQILRAWHGDMDSAFFQELWPDLAIVSSWDTSTSKRWALRLAELLPHADLQGKGLWATEGVVTLPYRGRMPLAVTSHFYEFVDLEDGEVYFAWELRDGQQVRPLLTTSSGFLRYAMNDRVVVRGRLHKTPCFEFLGRIGDVDMVGEKTSPESALGALDSIGGSARCKPVSLLALAPVEVREKPRYVALCEGPLSPEEDERRSEKLEETLRGAFHYALARDLEQLEPAKVITVPDARSLYEAVGVARGMVAGNIKVEPLLLCATAESVAQVMKRMHVPARTVLSYHSGRRN